MDFHIFCICESAFLRDALEQLDKTGRQILFVLKGSVLTGTLTDGDVRRHLLGGGTLEDTVDTAVHRRPRTASSREEARSMLRQPGVKFPAIPVLGADDTLLDIIFREEDAIPTLAKLALPVVIMAGGKGTRLEPYTKILPKPLIPVGDLPIIEHIMNQFMRYGCEDFHVIVNYKKQLMKAYFNESERQYQIHWYDEDKPLGTGGGLSLLKGHIHGTFFLTNCDILLQSDYEAMLRFHRESGNAVTMVAARKNLTIPYGVIEAGEGGVIEAMREKPELSFLTNTGMYIVEPEVLEDIQADVPIGFPDIMEQQRQKGRKIAVYSVDEDAWMDMGQMEELEKMRKRLYEG